MEWNGMEWNGMDGNLFMFLNNNNNYYCIINTVHTIQIVEKSG